MTPKFWILKTHLEHTKAIATDGNSMMGRWIKPAAPALPEANSNIIGSSILGIRLLTHPDQTLPHPHPNPHQSRRHTRSTGMCLGPWDHRLAQSVTRHCVGTPVASTELSAARMAWSLR